jgi:hypothetical protein
MIARLATMPKTKKRGAGAPRFFPNLNYSLGCGRLEDRHHRGPFHHRSRDSFEMRTQAAQLGGYKRIDEVEATIEPGKQLVLDVVMHRQGHFGAVRADLREINQTHEINISAGRFEGGLIGIVTLCGQQNGARLKTERPAKAEINRLGRGHGGFGHHDKLPTVGLDAGEPRFALRKRLTHVQCFL